MKKMKVTLLAMVLMSFFAQAVSADVKYEGTVAKNIVKKPILVSAVRKSNKKTVKPVKKTNKKTTKQVKKSNSTNKANTSQKNLANTVKKYKYFKAGDNNVLFVYVPATQHMLNSNAVPYKRYNSELAVINRDFYSKNKNFAKFYIVYDNQMSYPDFEKLFNKEKANKDLKQFTMEQVIAKFKYFKFGKDGKLHIYSDAKGDYLDEQFYEENKAYKIMKKYQPFQKDYKVETTLNLQMEYQQWRNMVDGKEYTVKVLNEKDRKQIEDAKSIKPVKDVKSASDDKFVQEFLSIINQKREEANLQALTADDSLNNLAKWKAQYMNKNNHFNHRLKDGTDIRKQVEDFGLEFSGTWAENIAFSTDSFTAEELFEQWYASEGHRKNMMNPYFTKMGIGVENGYVSLWLRSE
ncbi:cysteine-rich secretory family protein [Peptostreptococcaceae bacterium AS15]|nr:cysteine-rich secretory family protein [Peptostreptococcaceae bacterium AS15]